MHSIVLRLLFLCQLGADLNAESIVTLPKSTEVDLSKIHTLHDCVTAASNADMVGPLEQLCQLWCKKIEQVSSLNLIRF